MTAPHDPAQIGIFPKMGAPLRVITAAQIAAEQKLWLATGYNITHRAKVLGIKPDTLAYHLAPVRGHRTRIVPNVAKLIEAGDALIARLAKDGTNIAERVAWNRAKEKITRRKKDQ